MANLGRGCCQVRPPPQRVTPPSRPHKLKETSDSLRRLEEKSEIGPPRPYLCTVRVEVDFFLFLVVITPPTYLTLFLSCLFVLLRGSLFAISVRMVLYIRVLRLLLGAQTSLYYYVSSYSYMCVLILLYMCPHTPIYISAYSYICVLILLYVCPHNSGAALQ